MKLHCQGAKSRNQARKIQASQQRARQER